MLVGACQIELYVPSAQSLKEKRGVIKSIKDRIAQKFNVSIAEVDHLDKWQRSVLGIAVVRSDAASIDRAFSVIEDFLAQEARVQVVHWDQRIM